MVQYPAINSFVLVKGPLITVGFNDSESRFFERRLREAQSTAT